MCISYLWGSMNSLAKNITINPNPKPKALNPNPSPPLIQQAPSHPTSSFSVNILSLLQAFFFLSLYSSHEFSHLYYYLSSFNNTRRSSSKLQLFFFFSLRQIKKLLDGPNLSHVYNTNQFLCGIYSNFLIYDKKLITLY